jgi:hypothetical protein
VPGAPGPAFSPASVGRRHALRGVVLAVALSATAARGQILVRAGDDAFFRFGLLLQGWADFEEDATGGTQQNLFLRRTRFVLEGAVVRDVTFLLQTDSPNLGKSTQTLPGGPGGKSLGTGFQFLDAFADWRIADALHLLAGLYVVPLCRNVQQGSGSFLTLDAAAVTALSGPATQSTAFRDTGFGAKGYFLGDHLEYRASLFSGERQPGVKNPFRYAARVQYDVFDTETTYWYPGTTLGQKKILAFGAGSDNQGDYHAYSADGFFDLPVAGGDAAGGQLAWIHYDGETRFASLPRQNAYLAELGWYFSSAKLQPFAQLQTQRFSETSDAFRNVDRWQAGVNVYVHGQALKVTPAFTRQIPKDPAVAAASGFTVQIQVLAY